MPPKALPADLPVRPFPSRADFEAFLDENHATAPGVYVKFAKKASGIPSILPAEAVEVALCFGWIDGRGNSIDEKWWTVRYTPRTKKSMWSQKNVNTIARLTDEGKMRPAGIAAVDAAKADGRWERAYAGPATITVAEDLAAEMAAQPAAFAFFEGLNKSDRYSVLHRVETASPAARAQRIKMLVEQLAVGQVPGTIAISSNKPKQKVGPREKSVKASATKKKAPSSKSKKKEPDVNVKVPTQPRREGLRRRT